MKRCDRVSTGPWEPEIPNRYFYIILRFGDDSMFLTISKFQLYGFYNISVGSVCSYKMADASSGKNIGKVLQKTVFRTKEKVVTFFEYICNGYYSFTDCRQL